jgi:peptidoglycan hydrolase-like protein with peptidoglycan-binding domain
LTLSRFIWTTRSVVLIAMVAAFASSVATRAVVAHASQKTADRQSASATSAVGTKALRKGNSGARVAALQELLVAVGFKTSQNGTFDADTAKTVRKFQRAGMLTINGVADRATIARLKQAVRSAKSATSSAGGAEAGAVALKPKHLGDRIPLRRGMSGQDVRVLQSFLTRAGFKAKVTGDYDSRTVSRVKAFERANESQHTNGVMDANELSILRSDVEGGDDEVADEDATRTTPGEKARLGADGLAIAPESAPDSVKQIIAAGNKIAKKPYIYGGGHRRWNDRGYDCSGSVSFALRGADLLKSPMPSGPFMSWGKAGRGKWVTTYSNPGHMYMVVAGLRFDTSGRGSSGSRWQADLRSSSSFTARHPAGL